MAGESQNWQNKIDEMIRELDLLYSHLEISKETCGWLIERGPAKMRWREIRETVDDILDDLETYLLEVVPRIKNAWEELEKAKFEWRKEEKKESRRVPHPFYDGNKQTAVHF